MSNNFLNDKGEPVFDYDYHMSKIDDRTVTILKGHLLVEQRLYGLAETVFANPKYLKREVAKLSFNQLLNVVRAAVSQKPNEAGWDLISKLNKVRNLYVHNLEPPDLQEHLRALFNLDKQLDAGNDDAIADTERLKLVIKHCMKFLLALDFEHARLQA